MINTSHLSSSSSARRLGQILNDHINHLNLTPPDHWRMEDNEKELLSL